MRVPGLFLSTAALFATPNASLAAQTNAAPHQYRDAREQIPPALIGPWKVDLDASHYTGTKPQRAIRTFQYTAEGKVLVTFATVGANGAYSTGHWAAQADGTPAIEYHSAAGAIAYNVVKLTKVDEKTLNLTVLRHGKVDLEAVYKLSDDGQTLTYSYGDNRIIYRRWDKLD